MIFRVRFKLLQQLQAIGVMPIAVIDGLVTLYMPYEKPYEDAFS